MPCVAHRFIAVLCTESHRFSVRTTFRGTLTQIICAAHVCSRLQLATNRAVVHDYFKIVYLVGREMSAAAQQLVNKADHNASWRVAAAELMGLAEDDFSCPICMSMIRDPFVTDCGHTFCFQCITMHLVNKKSCPCCSTYVTADKIHPNFLLHKVCSGKDRLFCCTHKPAQYGSLHVSRCCTGHPQSQSGQSWG